MIATKTSLQLFRYTMGEPELLNLGIIASNGQQSGAHEFFCSVDDVRRAGRELSVFPGHRNDEFLWELETIYPSDGGTGASFFRVFVFNGRGHCAIQVRFDNNLELPDRAVTDFCIKAEAAKLNLLGDLLSKFARLKHGELWWDTQAGGFDDEPALEWASFQRPRST